MTLGDRFDEVMASARRGEAAGFEAIYRDLAPVVLGYLRGRGVRDPEDVAAEAFASVASSLSRFRGDEAAFRSWVFTIVHRRLVDERRRSARRREDAASPETLVSLGGADPAHLADPAEVALAHLGEERALTLLELLTDDQRAVVLLRVLAGLSVAEVARILGKRRGAVKTLQRRALARLARALGESRHMPETAQISPDTPEEVSS